MFHKCLITLILILTALPCSAQENKEGLVGFDLSLAGYRLGMSFDDVAKVRPFHYEQSAINNSGNAATFYALADHVHVDGVAMTLQVSFRNEKVHKIVARVSPGSFNDVLGSLQQTLGAGEDQSRVLRYYDDEELRQTIYLWDFPNAEMHLIYNSSNVEFATISLTDK